ncbi:hypothetical protein SLEP1_g20820 [Rubroshorea leprosula]|uniref:CRAL-TRIO domain-containing protein n=1 Tax=Rubroshorea leprosula TaxID=152421 RepID=A0AAV5J9T1_9ROSI|nr:hypothetical protein SLEP1_g20820 [Rubroshorea leprosula]
MSSDLKKSSSNGFEKPSISEEHQGKIDEVKKLIGPLPEKLAIFCNDACVARYLRARNWNVKKATKMLKASLKWRAEYKPEEIRWDEVAHEAETGKIYRSNYLDKHGRAVLVLRPGCQNSKSTKGQIRYLVYCMENAILNLPPDQEQIVWLIDYNGYSLSNISVKVTQETAHILQDQYPERLGLAILYDPPKFFEPFWTVVKPFLEPKTRDKVKFVYSDDPNTKKTMEDLFDKDLLESAFGGNDDSGFNIAKYAERMREDDKKMISFSTRGNSQSTAAQPTEACVPALDSLNLNSDSDASDNEKAESSPSEEINSEVVSSDKNIMVADQSDNGKVTH